MKGKRSTSNRTKGSKRGSVQRAINMRNPPSASAQYNGPVSPPSLEDMDTTPLFLVWETTLTSSAGGAIANVFGSSPSNAANWANSNTVYGEYRTLGFRVSYFPNNRYNKTTTTCRMLVGVAERRTATALASYATACSHSAVRKLSLEDPWSMVIKMDGVEEASFIPVGAPVDVSWLKFYADGLTVSTEYGLVLVEYQVQFRNVE